MNFNMSGPTYIGGTPSDFSITRITLDGEVYDTDCFQISDPSTGAIKLANTVICLSALTASVYLVYQMEIITSLKM